jgi:cytochrome c-type biogenesis protein CcmH
MLLALAAPALAAEPKASLPDIEDEVMCVECGTALNISTSAVADRQREFIQKLIDQGKTKAQIKAALVEEFGPTVLAEPEDDGFGLAAYIVPPLLVVLALLALLTTARRWRRLSEVRAPAGPDLSGDDRRRLERDMADYDR